MTPPQALLDTHVLLWMLTDPGRLSKRVRSLVTDPSVELFVSAASAWEIATKQRLGRLPQADVLVRGYERHLSRLGAQSVDITTAHALLAGALDWPHRDPFDRMIAAQCMIEVLPLISDDPAFGEVVGIRVLW